MPSYAPSASPATPNDTATPATPNNTATPATPAPSATPNASASPNDTASPSATPAPSNNNGNESIWSNDQISIHQLRLTAWTDDKGTWTVYDAYLTSKESVNTIDNIVLEEYEPSIKAADSWGAYKPATGDSKTWTPVSWAVSIQPKQTLNFGYKINSALPIALRQLVLKQN
eukprot:gene9002-10559_t